MKIFQTIQTHYAILGITNTTHQSTQKHPFSIRVFMGFLLFGSLNVLDFVYIFRVANGFTDYMNSICAASTSIIFSITFAAIVFRKSTLFGSIDSLEQLIDTSERRSYIWFH